MSDKPAIPDFKSHQEMAEWFETHEPLDYDVSLVDPDRVKVTLKKNEEEKDKPTAQSKRKVKPAPQRK